MIIAIGRDEGTTERPVREEAIVQDVEGLGLIAEVVFAPARFGLLCFLGAGGGVGRGLVGAIVVNIRRLGVAGRGPTAVVGAGRGITGTPLLALGAGGAGTLRRRGKAGQIGRASCRERV